MAFETHPSKLIPGHLHTPGEWCGRGTTTARYILGRGSGCTLTHILLGILRKPVAETPDGCSGEWTCQVNTAFSGDGKWLQGCSVDPLPAIGQHHSPCFQAAVAQEAEVPPFPCAVLRTPIREGCIVDTFARGSGHGECVVWIKFPSSERQFLRSLVFSSLLARCCHGGNENKRATPLSSTSMNMRDALHHFRSAGRSSRRSESLIILDNFIVSFFTRKNPCKLNLEECRI